MQNMTVTTSAQLQGRSIVRDSGEPERARQLARTLAPTVYCPESSVDECIASSGALHSHEGSTR